MTRFSPIAIVGQGCVLPGATTPGAFWESLISGTDLLGPVPEGRWRVDPATVSGTPSASQDATYSTQGGYVTGFERVFDAAGFEVPASSIEALDPLFQWVLHASRQALLDAELGAPLGSGSSQRGGIVLGNLSFPSEALTRLGESLFLEEHGAHLLGGRAAALAGVERPDARNRFMSGLPAHLAARALGLEAGGFCLDAACASSLYAIRIASDWLHEGRADVMLAGAVNRADSLFLHVGFCALQAMSPSGRSRPFHRDADGLVPAEGAAVLALMRLEDAVRQGRRVLGVIRGVGLSNDGRARNLLAPSSSGQVRAMRAAYDMAGIAPADVSLVECHATGTQTGDATEVASLREVFAGVPDPVRIGSLKSNLGHLITAAGAAGLMKVLGALAYKRIPPTLHVDEPLGAFAERDAPCRLVTAAEDWAHDDDKARLAAVSAFGFGGNNAHLLVEEYREVRDVTAVVPARATRDERLAIVGIGARVGGLDRDALRRALLEGSPTLSPETLVFDATGMRFPPNDLKSALPQQVLAFEAAREAVSDAGRELCGPRVGVVVGMGCDVDITSPGVRWRAREWTRRWNHEAGLALDEDAQLRFARALGDAACPAVSAQAVLGQMPNIPANRLNVQLDLTGPGFTVSAEELSGIAALSCARSWLASEELDAVIVGAVDVCRDFRHVHAVEQVRKRAVGAPLDAAVALVVRRLSDAERDGDHIYAIVAGDGGGTEPHAMRLVAPAIDDDAAPSDPSLSTALGHAHAATALLHVTAAALYLDARARPGMPAKPQPWLTNGAAPAAVVQAGGLGGASATVTLHATAGAAGVGTARPVVLGVSAPTTRELSRRARGILSGETLVEAAGREGARLAVVGRDHEEASSRLRAACEALESGSPTLPPGVHVGEGPAVRNEQLALVFGSAAGPYPGMGRELLLAFPEVSASLQRRVGDLERAFGETWLSASTASGAADRPYLEQLLAASSLSQAHATFSHDVLGVRAGNAIGYSLGESNALFAFGAWQDLDGMLRDVTASSLFSADLANEHRAVRTWLRERGDVALAEAARVWTSVLLHAPVADVRRALAEEPHAFITLINTPTEVVIGGVPEACERIARSLGCTALESPSAPAVHCAALAPVAEPYRALHRRPTRAPASVRFYGHAHGAAYDVSEEACADAILGQALHTVDFPALIQRAYDDGVRVFIDHGPRGLCAGWIGSILKDRPHLAVAYDSFGRSSSHQAANVAAALYAAGVELDLKALAPRVSPRGQKALEVRVPAGRRFGRVPPLAGAATALTGVDSMNAQPMNRAPSLPSVRSLPTLGQPPREPDVTPPPAMPPSPPERLSPPAATHVSTVTETTSTARWRALSGARQDLAAAHQAFLESQGQAHSTFLELRSRQTEHLARAVQAAPVVITRPEPAKPALAPFSAPPAQPSAPPTPPPSSPSPPALAKSSSARHEPAPHAPPDTPSRGSRERPMFDRRDLERLASGRISEVLGPLFSRQDNFRRQVRMPEPPLLLCDRVLDIDAEPGVLATQKTIWTESDVRWDSWYLHHGRIPPGVLIEAGQADLLLISWMGVDFENKGERVYRLLGCDLTYHGALPAAGTTLHYDIHIDNFATHGATRLFFFHSDARRGGPEGELALSVRNGQAGFFTDEELAESGGCLWEPEDVDASALADLPLATPPCLTTKRRFSREDLEAWAAGDALACFGPGFERTRTHVRTPAPAGGDMLLLDRVSDVDARGGPWGRGYLRAELDFTPERWFFDGHFKDDPCMPGTLMFEGCLQAMSFLLAAQGFTTDRDGWRFEPAKEEQFKLRCRGQAIPSSKYMVYELFVREVRGGDKPRVTADILVTIDGLKSLTCEAVGVELVPDYPLYGSGALLGEAPKPSGWDAVGGVGRDDDGAAFGQTSLLATGIGKPSDGFGALYADFDYTRRLARMPGPPYHFMSRVRSVEGPPIGAKRAGNVAAVEYDVPPDAWFFAENGDRTMPFAVLLEVALQPCGWVSSYVGSMRSEKDLYYRNLDGKGRVHRTLGPDAGTLTTTVRMTSASESGGLIIQQFTFETRDAHGLVFDGETTFGFFPPEALARQVGVGASDAERARLLEPSPPLDDGTSLPLDLRARPAQFFPEGATLAGPMLLNIDRLTGVWPSGGSQGLGFARAEKDVDESEWFFKAHFYQDPVQPGSLGVEAMLQTLQAFMLARGLTAKLLRPVFEPIAPGADLVWRYRGQVVPEREKVVVEVDVLSIAEGSDFVDVTAQAWLWCDGLRIYHAPKLTMRARGAR